MGKKCVFVCRFTMSVIAALLLASLSCAQQYSVTDLGHLGASGISNTGEVVGAAGVDGPGTPSRAAVWTKLHGVQMFGLFPGGHFSFGTAINHSGIIVGAADFSNYVSHAFLCLGPGKPLKDLGVLFHSQYSQANGINDSNVVIGFAFTPGGAERAFRWTSTTGMQGLDSLTGGFTTTANAINNTGQIVGFSDRAGIRGAWHACLWPKPNGVIPVDLGTLPGYSYSFAFGINRYGEVVGETDNATGPGHAVRWSAATGMKDLGLLNGTLATSARAINDSGVVVGAAFTPANAYYHAFVWTPAGGMKDLNKLIPSGTGWVLVIASAINSEGQIVGFGKLNGQEHWFLLTPK